jgi:hypothetical protein
MLAQFEFGMGAPLASLVLPVEPVAKPPQKEITPSF